MTENPGVKSSLKNIDSENENENGPGGESRVIESKLKNINRLIQMNFRNITQENLKQLNAYLNNKNIKQNSKKKIKNLIQTYKTAQSYSRIGKGLNPKQIQAEKAINENVELPKNLKELKELIRKHFPSIIKNNNNTNLTREKLVEYKKNIRNLPMQKPLNKNQTKTLKNINSYIRLLKPREELNTVPIPTNNGSGNELGNNPIKAGEAQTGVAPLGNEGKGTPNVAIQRGKTTSGGRSWYNTFTGAGRAARNLVGKGAGKGLAAVQGAASLGYTGYIKNKGFVNSTKYPIPYNLKNIKNSRRISNRLKIKFSGNEADKHFQIAKGLFAIRHPLLKENYIGEVLKMNDEQLAILSGIKEINKTNYEKRMDITKLLGLQLAVNKFYETGSYLINPEKKENYKIYYSNKVDNKNIYKVLHFYITKGIEGLDQKYTTLDFTIFSSSSIQSLDDVVRYIIAMTREFYIYRYPQKGEEKTIEQLNKLIEYLFSEEEQKKKIKYLDTYLKNLKVEMDRFKARNQKVLKTEIQTMQRYFNATSHSKAIKNIIEVFKQANSKKNLRT